MEQRTPYQSQRQATCLPLVHRDASVCIRGGSPAIEYQTAHGIIASLWGDFTIFSIYYLSRIDKDKVKALFDCLCKTHESLSSANGRVKIKEEKLILDENITSLSDMVNFQLNI